MLSPEMSEDSDTEDCLVVGVNYTVEHKIGQGSFGVIFEGTNLLNSQKVAIKFETRKCDKSQLRVEYKAYRILSGCPGFPQIYHFGEEGPHNILVIDLLGPSLENLFNMCGRKFSIKTTCMVAKQMLSRVETIHRRYLIYRDIKPDNFLVGCPGSDAENTVHVVDFGMAKHYQDPKTKQHIPYRQRHSGRGTARYASINSHMGREQSRRDDLEALGHVFMYFLRGSLPWQGLEAATNKHKYLKIGDKKLTTSIPELCRGFPEEFGIYLNYVRKLGFEETADYEYLRALFTNVLKNSGEIEDDVYDWMMLNVEDEWESGSESTNSSLLAASNQHVQDASFQITDQVSATHCASQQQPGPGLSSYDTFNGLAIAVNEPITPPHAYNATFTPFVGLKPEGLNHLTINLIRQLLPDGRPFHDHLGVEYIKGTIQKVLSDPDSYITVAPIEENLFVQAVATKYFEWRRDSIADVRSRILEYYGLESYRGDPQKLSTIAATMLQDENFLFKDFTPEVLAPDLRSCRPGLTGKYEHAAIAQVLVQILTSRSLGPRLISFLEFRCPSNTVLAFAITLIHIALGYEVKKGSVNTRQFNELDYGLIMYSEILDSLRGIEAQQRLHNQKGMSKILSDIWQAMYGLALS